MSKREKIYGIVYSRPEEPRHKEISGCNAPKRDQVFHRHDLPDFMLRVKLGPGKVPLWDEEQRKYIAKEHRRCKFDGVWFMCNGTPTYITKLHYFYLQYYVLEDGTRPEYRDTDRRFFYFMEYCLSKGYVKGIIRLKKRREGATSQICCWLLWTAIFFSDARCGLVSKTDTDARTAFEDMVLSAWKKIPTFFQPEHDDKTSSELRLKAKRKKQEEEEYQVLEVESTDGGQNSTIRYRATTMNSFDSGRLTALLLDESAKFPPQVPINQYLPIVAKTMMQGIKRVGFMVLPTSMNEAGRGGRSFKKIWLESDHFHNERTASGLYRFFLPAYDGYPGFIGKYGESVIDKPTRSQYEWLRDNLDESADLLPGDLKLGAKAYLEGLRKNIKDPMALAEEKRMNPFNEEEALMDEDVGGYFNLNMVNDQIDRTLRVNPYIRVGRLYEDENGIVHFTDDPTGPWHFLKLPPTGIANTYKVSGGVRIPQFAHKYKVGVDPFRNTRLRAGGIYGSNGAIVVGEAFDSADPENTGMPIGYYLDRPPLKHIFYKEVYMCVKFFSCKACIETDIDDYYETFMQWRALPYVRNTPRSVIDPTLTEDRKNKLRREKGIKSGDRFMLNKELEIAQVLVNNHIDKIWFLPILEGLKDYDHEDRTAFDIIVAFMMMACDMAAETRHDEIPLEKGESMRLVRTYSIGGHGKILV